MQRRKYKLTHGNHGNKLGSMDESKKHYTYTEIAKQHGITRQAVAKRAKKYKVPYMTFGKTKVIEKINLYLLKF